MYHERRKEREREREKKRKNLYCHVARFEGRIDTPATLILKLVRRVVSKRTYFVHLYTLERLRFVIISSLCLQVPTELFVEVCDDLPK